jgi:ABC-type multidrug transport system fused ATPase/permease subunit
MKLSIFSTLVDLYKLDKSGFIFLLTCILVDALSNILNLSLMYPIVSSFNSNFSSNYLFKILNVTDNDSLLKYTILVLLFSSALKLFLNTKTLYSINKYIENIRVNFTNKIATIYISKKYSDIAFLNKGTLINNWFNEVVAGTRFIRSVINSYSSLLQCIALIILGFIIDKKSMIIVIIAILMIAAFMTKKYIFSALHFSAKKVDNNSSLLNIMDEVLTNYREIKILGLEKYFKNNINLSIKELAKDSAKSQIESEKPKALNEFFLILIFSVFFYLLLLIYPNDFRIILPKLIFYFLIFYKLSNQFTQLLTSFIRSLNDISSFNSCLNVVNDKKNYDDLKSGRIIKSIKHNLFFKNLSFNHSNKEILCNFNCEIIIGKIIAFTGISGKGKSTILDLLLQIQTPSKGNIYLGKRPINSFNLSSWRNCFGFVSQDMTLFNDSVRNNFKMVDPKISDSQIFKLTKICCCFDVIKNLPHGLSTLVGSRGAKLSGGQRKRIAIARALIRKPSILILDEVTTSFEKSLEASVLSNIKIYFPSITIITVTHRLTNPELYDYIIKL